MSQTVHSVERMNAPVENTHARAVGSPELLRAIDPFHARDRLRGHVIHTPMRRLSWLERLVGVPVWAKLECQQHTGSFKFRGAFNKLLGHPLDRKVIAASAGNHGLAVAEVAAQLGLKANICIPTTASRLKRERILATGAGLIEHGSSLEQAIKHAQELSAERGWTFISPYNDRDVIAGNATIALEMLEQVPDLRSLIVPVGGGGLITGMALGARALDRSILTIGCEPERYASLGESLKQAQVTRVVHQPTLADGLAVNLEPDAITFHLARHLVDEIVSLSEEELAAGTLAILTHESLLVEPAGAAAVVACLKLAAANRLHGPVGIPLAGGNLHHTKLARIQHFPYTSEVLLRLLDLRGRRVQDISVAHSKLEPPVSAFGVQICDASSDLRRQIDTCVSELVAVRADFEDFIQYCWAQGLAFNSDVVDAVLGHTNATIASLQGAKADMETDSQMVHAEAHLRWGRHVLAYARRGLEWCSPSYVQACAPQFFDLGAQDNPTVNYERYESTEVQRIEMQLMEVLGLDAERFTITVTSSGMASYTLIEAFLLRHRLQPGDKVLLGPYIYFEASQQIETLTSVQCVRCRSYEVADMLRYVDEHRPRVIFIDLLTNTVDQRCFDLTGFLRQLRARKLGSTTVVIDGTMLPCCLGSDELRSDEHVEIIYYESCSKYLQLGMDASMAGLIAHPVEARPAFNVLRRNTGTILYRHSAILFPTFDRSAFLRRMSRISGNARRLAEYCHAVESLRDYVEVIYPTLDNHPDRATALQLPHGGGCVTFRLLAPGGNYRDQLEALIEDVIHRAQQASLPLSKGVSFGFSIPRLSAASAMAENDPPFLRFYAGDLSSELIERLARMLVESLASMKERQP